MTRWSGWCGDRAEERIRGDNPPKKDQRQRTYMRTESGFSFPSTSAKEKSGSMGFPCTEIQTSPQSTSPSSTTPGSAHPSSLNPLLFPGPATLAFLLARLPPASQPWHMLATLPRSLPLAAPSHFLSTAILAPPLTSGLCFYVTLRKPFLNPQPGPVSPDLRSHCTHHSPMALVQLS